MGFFDRGKAPASKASSSKPGNEGKGNARDGYPRGSTTPGYIDYRNPADNGAFYEGTKRQQYRDDPNARLLHSPGSSRAEQSGWWETSGKNLSDIHEPWVEPSAEWYAQDEREQAARRAERQSVIDSNPALKAAYESGDLRAYVRALTDMKREKMREHDQKVGDGTSWPKPRSPLGAYSHGPGREDWDTRFTNPPPPNTAGGGRSGSGSDAANTPGSGRELNEWLRDHPEPQGGGDGMNAIQGYLGDTAMAPRQGMPQFAQAQGGPSDVLAALSRIQSMPIGAPTAATGSPGGFARAASGIAPAMSAAVKKPTIVRRGGGQVDMR